MKTILQILVVSFFMIGNLAQAENEVKETDLCTEIRKSLESTKYDSEVIKFFDKLVFSKLKYKASIGVSSSILDIEDVVDDSEDSNENDNDDELNEETKTIYSTGIEYEINFKNIIDAFNVKTDWEIFDVIMLKDIVIKANGKYSNTFTSEDLNVFTSNQFEKKDGFDYGFGVEFTGCIGDLFKKGIIGCEPNKTGKNYQNLAKLMLNKLCN